MAERVVRLLPPLLDSWARSDLIRKLREYYRRPVFRMLTTTFESWVSDLKPLAEEVIAKSPRLPDEVVQAADWLADDECLTLQSLLTQAEADEARLRLSYLWSEFTRLEHLVTEVGGAETVRHEVVLPQGIIQVTIERPMTTLWRKFLGE